MIYRPRPYQEIITDHTTDVRRGARWAGMGLGKTVSTLTAIEQLQFAGMGRALVLAPLRVAQSTWPDEALKWAHLSGTEVRAVVGTEKQRLEALHDNNAAVLTINYENIPWLTETLGKRWPFSMVVPDEATKLKGFRLRKSTERAKALAAIARRTTYWSNLTGTPAPNGWLDVWGPQWFVDQGAALGRSFTDFRSRWFMAEDPYSDYPKMVLRPFAEDEIRERLTPTTLVVRTEDWFDLKAPIVNRIFLDLPTKARRLYDKMARDFVVETDGLVVEAPTAAAKRNVLEQIASGAVYVDDQDNPLPSDEAGGMPAKARRWLELHDVKLQALEEVLEEAGGPVLVSYKFRHSLARILKAFPQLRRLDSNPQTIRDWNAGKVPGLVAHPASAGHGLNLQDGGHVLAFFDVDENLELHDQIVERIGPVRQLQAGHDRAVMLHYLIGRYTVNEQSMARLSEKRADQDLLTAPMARRRPEC